MGKNCDFTLLRGWFSIPLTSWGRSAGSVGRPTLLATLRFYVAEKRVGEGVADGREAYSAPLSGAIFTMAK